MRFSRWIPKTGDRRTPRLIVDRQRLRDWRFRNDRQSNEELDHQRIHNVDEEGTDERNDPEGLLRRTVFCRNSRQIRDPNGRRSQSQADKASGDDRRIEVAPHHPEDDHHGEQGDHEDLHGQNGDDGADRLAKGPKLHTHQTHAQKQLETDLTVGIE